MVNRKEPELELALEREPQSVLSPPAPGGNLISAFRLWVRILSYPADKETRTGSGTANFPHRWETQNSTIIFPFFRGTSVPNTKQNNHTRYLLNKRPPSKKIGRHIGKKPMINCGKISIISTSFFIPITYRRADIKHTKSWVLYTNI
jgi:hypothetical protein